MEDSQKSDRVDELESLYLESLYQEYRGIVVQDLVRKAVLNSLGRQKTSQEATRG